MAQVKAGPGLHFDLTRSLLSSHTLVGTQFKFQSTISCDETMLNGRTATALGTGPFHLALANARPHTLRS